MTKIILKNSLGKVCMSGGGKNKIRLTEIKGLEFVPKTYKTIKFSGCDGAETVEAVHSVRTVTGSGDMFFDTKNEVQKIYDAFAESGEMLIHKGGKKYKIAYKPISFEITEFNSSYCVFVFQMVCDSPCFKELTPKSYDVFSRTDKIKHPFSLPAVFTERTSKVNIINDGHKKSEPVIYIDFIKKPASGASAQILISNHTTGQTLKLNSDNIECNRITLDIENRKVYSEDGDNLEHFLDENSFLSDFHIIAGVNNVEVLNNSSCEIISSLEFYPLYLGI